MVLVPRNLSEPFEGTRYPKNSGRIERLYVCQSIPRLNRAMLTVQGCSEALFCDSPVNQKLKSLRLILTIPPAVENRSIRIKAQSIRRSRY